MMLLAAVLGLVSCACGVAERPVRVRRWVPHLVMAAAMAAMALPEVTPGPLGWCLLLAATVIWVARDDDLLAAGLPVAYDLLGMAGLLFVHWRAALGGHASMHEETLPDRSYTWAAVAVVALWAVARFGAVPRTSHPHPWARIGGPAMAAAMALMLLT
ncbi:hypothetical protein [Streptomyces aurantiogriseus]|uniref:Uncharacterized protein n=1 Tax=Streptomyces aurantiogriseus TaxID=66870 RepID=A0A918L093_9ACTN|nr:hypothetical protein [Streptomyces aurantiogriseus]GGR63219.1 hypothetical protein GCM10010251_94870 [Streptomyces aurantiogriseus]